MKVNDQTTLFLDEVLALLKGRIITKAIDATFAGGGHGMALAWQGIKVLGIEWDSQMCQLGQANIAKYGLGKQIKLVKGNFANLAKLAQSNSFAKVDLVIFDLGLSMYQLKYGARGFSFKGNETLDLRISRNLKTRAKDIINSCTRNELYEIFTKHIEDINSRRLVDLIFKYRLKQKIETVGDLMKVISQMNLMNKQANNLLRKTLQGLRIVVNDELRNLRQGLKGAISSLRENGLLLVITFHSLEDRIVKLELRQNEEMKALGKAKQNKSYTFARGAKLRTYERTN